MSTSVTQGKSTKCSSCASILGNLLHNESTTPLYKTWARMKMRCSNSNFSQFKDYGGRGIKVCDDWLYSYRDFAEWAKSNNFKPGLHIHRIDNDGDYEPTNCTFMEASDHLRLHKKQETGDRNVRN
jgi:hypothetical protein